MHELKAKDIMNAEVLSISADWSVNQLSNFLDEHSISGGPVVSEDGTLVGVVSRTDIVRNNSVELRAVRNNKPHDFYIDDLDNQYASDIYSSLTVDGEETLRVSDIMTPLIFDVNENTRVQLIADAMIRGRIHRVFVTDEEKLLGIITTMDLLDIIRNQ